MQGCGDGYSNNAPLCVLAILHQVLLHPPTAALSVVYAPTTAKHICLHFRSLGRHPSARNKFVNGGSFPSRAVAPPSKRLRCPCEMFSCRQHLVDGKKHLLRRGKVVLLVALSYFRLCNAVDDTAGDSRRLTCTIVLITVTTTPTTRPSWSKDFIVKWQ